MIEQALVDALAIPPPEVGDGVRTRGFRPAAPRLQELSRNVEQLKRLQAGAGARPADPSPKPHEVEAARAAAEAAVAAARAAAAIAAAAADSAASASKPERLREGKLAWTTPETMRMDETRSVELLVTVDPTLFARLEGEVRNRDKASASVQSAAAELSKTLGVSLESPAFDIVPSGVTKQQLREGKYASWSWKVSPKRPGAHALQLTVVSYPEGGPVQESFSRTIQVIAVPVPAASAPSLGDQTLEFLLKNWKDLWLIVFAPILGGLWLWIKRRRAASAGVPLPPIAS